MTNLILCGGSGTRLWPLSRPERPKQFVPLIQGRSLFEETVIRNKPFCSSFFLTVGESLLDVSLNQLRGLGVEVRGGVVEPIGRNTAPAIALACRRLDADELVLVSPSDHVLTHGHEYAQALRRAAELADEGRLVTFGLKALSPETGYGYIEADGETVVKFHEKPDRETAEAYVRSGRYWWNSGMFVFRAGVFLEELRRCAPDVWDACARVPLASGLTRPTVEEMAAIPSVAVDVAVMQKSSKVSVVACDLGWSDVGGFEALFETLGAERDGNRVLDTGAVTFHEAKDNLVMAQGRRVTLMNVDDLLVVDTPDELLIARRGTNPATRRAET